MAVLGICLVIWHVLCTVYKVNYVLTINKINYCTSGKLEAVFHHPISLNQVYIRSQRLG